jgi:hypothetical protein
MHKEALEQERACQIVKARGGIKEAMASGASKKSCCWCYEVSLLAV